jgi:tRNA nucleotidyltransferase/poly(A) polymerase
MPRPVDPEQQRQFATEVVTRLQQAGYQACFAGGCVRDRLLGREPKDYDIATAATPDEVQALLGQRRTLPIGAAFGVVTAIGPRGAGQVDVATFRRDGTYSDGRHPDQVTYSSAEEDARRRDFTINGMFFDPVAQQVIDYVGGQADLERGTVRAIGQPEVRFGEDKLRMLRAVRFAATLGFEIERATADAIRGMADQLPVVSCERIAGEMQRILVDLHRARALMMLRETRLAEVLFAGAGPIDDEAWDRGLRCADRLASPSFPLALAALLGEWFDATAAEQLARNWRLSNDTTRRLAWLVAHRNDLAGATRKRWSAIQPLLAHQGGGNLVALCSARAALGELAVEDMDYCRERLAWPAEQLDPPPLITGNDLGRLGVPQGTVYRQLLEAVRCAQLDGEVQSKDEAVALAKQLYSSRSGERHEDERGP